MDYQPLRWQRDRLVLLDQTRLPHEEVYLELTDYRDVASAIAELRVRGAPAIAVAGAYGVVLGALKITAGDAGSFREGIGAVIGHIAAVRSTAVNIFFALERMREASGHGGDMAGMRESLLA